MISSRLLVALTSVFLGCAAPRVGPHSVSNAQLITEDEIDATRANTAFDVIQKLRANFLTYRGETSFDKSKSRPFPTVYVDGQEYGPIGSLRLLLASDISSIRLYRAWEATTKFGTGNMGGVIAITTKQ
jgi:hypothetical protein